MRAPAPDVEAPEALVRSTFRRELVRAVPVGTLETVWSTFAILIAVHAFEAGDTAKGTLLSAGRAGLIVSLFSVPLLRLTRWSGPKLAAVISAGGGIGFALAGLFPGSLPVFVAGVSIGMFSFSLQIPLLTQLYRANYPKSKRGTLFALSGMLRSAVAIAFSLAGGWFLDAFPDGYPLALGIFSAASFASGFVLAGMPVRESEDDGGSPAQAPFHALRWIRYDRQFRLLLASWMTMGLANLMAISLYVEYFASSSRGLGLTATTVSVLTGVIPMTAKVATAFFWGRLFDRLNFYLLRILLNLFCMAAVLLVYSGGALWVAGLGMAAHGVALGGGNVAWNLWVTKIAPANRVADYMSVHTFMTGLRAMAAPAIAFAIIDAVSFRTFAWSAAALIAIASIMLAPRARILSAANAQQAKASAIR